MSSARLYHSIFSTLLALGLAANVFAAEEVTIGADKYEEVERWSIGGELIVRLKPKISSGASSGVAAVGARQEIAPETTLAASNPPGAKSSESKTADGKSDEAAKSSNPWGAILPSQEQSFYDTLAKEDAANTTDSPGLNVLGVNVGDINHPTTPKDFAMSLAKGTNSSGSVKEGVAMQFAPATLFFPKTLIGGKAYVNSSLMQMWARTSIEIATAKSDNKQIGQQLAASLSVGLIDQADPRLFWADDERCASEQMKTLRVPDPPLTDEKIAAFNLLQEEQLKLANECKSKKWEETSKSLWKKPRWYAGAAKGWNTGDSTKARDLKSGPAMVWTTFSKGIESVDDSNVTVRKLVEFSLAKKWSLPIEDSKDTSKLLEENRTDAVVRLRFSRERWNAFVDAGLSRVRTAGALSTNVRRFGYGAEYRVDDNLWLVLGSIVEHGYVIGDSKRTLLNMGLRFGQTNKEVFQPLGPQAKEAKLTK